LLETRSIVRLPLFAVCALIVAAACRPADRKEPEAAATVALPSRDTVIFETDKGRIVMELNREKAPETVANFVKHVRAGFYDGLIFHRVKPGFVIQAGLVTESMAQRKSTVFPIANEAQNGLKNLRGTVAMARSGDPHSATSEFFVNLVDNTKLDFTAPTLEGWGYAVFGRVIEGMDVVDAIAKTRSGRRGPYAEFPEHPTVIRRAYLKDSPPAGG
jgi:peptidyl-prolyl cis-trans isomerase B (cyclophilin B)